MGKFEQHDFYCLSCGRKGIPLMRKNGWKHERGHRKVLYCPYCKTEVNHIEISSFEEAEKFKEDFANGVYAEEAAESLKFMKEKKLIFA